MTPTLLREALERAPHGGFGDVQAVGEIAHRRRAGRTQDIHDELVASMAPSLRDCGRSLSALSIHPARTAHTHARMRAHRGPHDAQTAILAWTMDAHLLERAKRPDLRVGRDILAPAIGELPGTYALRQPAGDRSQHVDGALQESAAAAVEVESLDEDRTSAAVRRAAPRRPRGRHRRRHGHGHRQVRGLEAATCPCCWRPASSASMRRSPTPSRSAATGGSSTRASWWLMRSWPT